MRKLQCDFEGGTPQEPQTTAYTRPRPREIVSSMKGLKVPEYTIFHLVGKAQNLRYLAGRRRTRMGGQNLPVLPIQRNQRRSALVFSDMAVSEASRQHRVCPWWLGYLLIGPLRRLQINPAKILASHVREGMTVLEPGPGMGFFTLVLAGMVGETGRVVAVDIQARMLDRLQRRARKAGVAERIDARLGEPESLRLGGIRHAVDFTLAFAVVHEMPSADGFFAQARQAMKPGARLLLVEPKGHVTEGDFQVELDSALKAGFCVAGRPPIGRNWSALLESRGL